MTDSRTVLDRNGAETLLGSGDMLFLPTGKPDPVRVHGAYISNEETARLVSFLRRQGKPAYFFDFDDEKGTAQLSAAKEDELFEKALEIVVGTQMGSTSLLQRRLSIGYARAGRLMDLLESNGVVGPYKGSKCRDVLVGPEYLETARPPAPRPASSSRAHLPHEDDVLEEDEVVHEDPEEEDAWEDDHGAEEEEEDADGEEGGAATKKKRPRADDEDEYEEEDVTYDEEDDDEDDDEDEDDEVDHDR